MQTFRLQRYSLPKRAYFGFDHVPLRLFLGQSCTVSAGQRRDKTGIRAPWIETPKLQLKAPKILRELSRQ
jgi:hypothetical protein